MDTVPVIETSRLTLRGWRDEDLDGLAHMMADPAVTRFLGGTLSRNNTWRVMATFVGHWTLRGFGFWVVERKSDHAFLGRVGLWQPAGWPGTELGWALDAPFWGQGYAVEATRAALDYSFATYKLPKLISLIEPEHRSSHRLAERLGLTRGKAGSILIRGSSTTFDIWEIERERWLETRASGGADDQSRA